MTDRERPPPSAQQVETHLTTIRRSMEALHDLVAAAARRDDQIRSLDAELASARARIATLEAETSTLRARLAGPVTVREMDDLIEEQTMLAHMLVTSDRLARAVTPAETLAVTVEVLHDLAGARRWSLWLRFGERQVAVAPAEPGWRPAPAEVADLVATTFEAGEVSRSGGAPVPAAWPLPLDQDTVGVLVVTELVPHGDRVARLHDEVVRFLTERLAPTLVATALGARRAAANAWSTVADQVPEVTP